jgi:hypothetical protein
MARNSGAGRTLMKSPMGMAVRASLVGRAPAAGGVADAVRDDAGQDEGHARDADHVRGMLGCEARLNVVVDLGEMDRNVQHAADGHQCEAEDHRERQSPESFYRKH